MSQSIDNRHIRIFISSTFSDMQDERNELVSKVFPLLRKEAAKRGVTLTDIDLRWGITKEESESSKVIDICLDEIDKSHPFFIGLLGRRYGWKPSDDKNIDWQSKIAPRHGWVLDDIKREMSITEMEIQYGTLRNDAPIQGMFFLKECDESAIAPEQARLRREVKEQSRFPVYSYDSIQSLSDQVIKVFSDLLDKLFPVEEEASLQVERQQQRYWLEQKTRHFIGREQSDMELLAFMESDAQNLLVTGDSGMGKSTWLAHVTLKAMDIQDGREVIALFAGNGNHDATFSNAADWLCRNIADLYNMAYDTSKDPISELRNLALQLQNKSPLLIIIDGINQLVGENAAERNLTWWPAWPDNVKIIFSMPQDADMARELDPGQWTTMYIGRLDIDQRVRLAEDYLADYRKILSSKQKDILGDDSSLLNNSLIYSTLLDEIRRYGDFDRLNDFMMELMACSDADQFFGKIIDRQSTLFVHQYNNLVRDALSLICLSENGLTETQLLKITGVSRLALSQFLSANELHLTCKDGKVTTVHDMFRHAVMGKYLTDEQDVKLLRQRIIDYFEAEDDIQGLSELPYQYFKTGNLDALYHVICQSRELCYFTEMHRGNVYAGYWATLIKHNPIRYDIVGYVINAMTWDSDLQDTPNILNKIVSVVDRSTRLLLEIRNFISLQNLFLIYVKSPIASRRLGEAILKAIENEQDAECDDLRHQIQASIAASESMAKDWFRALTHSKSLLEESQTDMSSNIVSNIGEMYLSMYEKERKVEYLDNALKILKEVLLAREAKCNGIPNHNLATAYANYGCALQYKDPKTAEVYTLKSIELYREVAGANSVDVAQEYHNLGVRYVASNPTKALEYATQALQIYLNINGENSVDTIDARTLVALIYLNMAEYDQAYKVVSTAVSELLKYEKKPYIWPTVLDTMFRAAYFSERYDEAVKVGLHMIELYGEDYFPTIKVLEDIGKVYIKKNDYDMAVKYYDRAAVIADSMAEFERELESYVYFAKAMYEINDMEKVLQIFGQIDCIAHMHGLEESRAMAFMLFNRAMLNLKKGDDLADVIADIRKAIVIYETHYPDDRVTLEQYRQGLESAIRLQEEGTSNNSIQEKDIPEIAEMASYLNGTFPEVLDRFTQGMLQFKAGYIEPAEHFFMESLQLISDTDIDSSVMALVLRFIAFSKELRLRNIPGSENKRTIIEIYDRAIKYANRRDNNPTLTSKIAHDAAAFCLYLEDFDRAENYYLEEMFQTIYPRDIYNIDFVIVLLNLTTLLKRKRTEDDILFTSMYGLGYTVCKECEAEDTEVFSLCSKGLSSCLDKNETVAEYISDPGVALRTIANYVQTTNYDEKYVLASCLLYFAVLYCRQCADKQQEAFATCEYVVCMLHLGRYDKAISVLRKGQELIEKYGTDELIEQYRVWYCICYVLLHDIPSARQLCEAYNLNTDLIAKYEQEMCPCYYAWKRGDTKVAESIADEFAAKDKTELDERSCYDLIIYNHARGKIYEARKYAELWKYLAMADDNALSELFKPAYKYICELLK